MALNNASYSFMAFVKQANGQPYDLTSRSLIMGFKNSTGQSPAGSTTIQTGDSSIAVQSPATSGIFTGTLSKTQTALMAQGTWYWDLLDVTNPNVPIALGAGILPVRQGITNSATPVIPRPGLLLSGGNLDAIQVTAPGDSITLTLAPSGPAGPAGSNVGTTVDSFGARGDGITDDSAAINAAIAWSAANGAPVYVLPKTYACGAGLNAASNASVTCLPGATFLRAFNSSGASGLLSQANPSVKISNFSWTGGRLTTAAFATTTGNTSVGSNVITGVSSFAGLAVGDFIAGQQAIPSGTQITALNPGAGTITLGANALLALTGATLTTCHYGGNMVGLYGDNILLDHLTIDTFAGGRAIAINGNNPRIIVPTITNPLPVTGTGGVRCTGGTNFLCLGGIITAGDDACQFATVAPGGPHSDDTIIGGAYIGCTAVSLFAHAFVVGMTDQSVANGVRTMTGSIKGCSFVGLLSGGSGGKAGSIHNENSSGVIQNILVDGIDLAGDANNTAVMVVAGYGTLAAPCAVKDVAFRNVSLIAPVMNGLVVQGVVSGITWDGGNIEAPSTPGNQAVLLKGLQGGSFRGRFAGGASIDVALLTNDANGDLCADVDFSGSVFENIPNGFYGLNCANANNCGAGYGTVFAPASGAATAGSVNLGAGSTHCYLIGADIIAMSAQGGGNYESLNVASVRGHIVNSLYGDATAVGGLITPVTTLPSGNQPITPSAQYTPVLDNTALTADRGMTVHNAKASDGCVLKLSRKGSTGGHNRNVYQDDGVTLIKAVPDNNFLEITYSASLLAWYESDFGAL